MKKQNLWRTSLLLMMFVSLGTLQAQTTYETLYIRVDYWWVKSRPKSDPAIWKKALSKYDKDCTYVGEVRSGLPNGFGRLTDPQWGLKYIGEWKDGNRHGQGAESFGNVKYVGDFKNGNRHGQGAETFASEKYVGGFKNGKYHGHGTFTSSKGEYVGAFKDGLFNGHGIKTAPSGHKYVGEFKDDKMHGKGTITTPDGSEIKGIFMDGKLVGMQFEE